MQIKQGVSLKGAQPQLAIGLQVAESVFVRFGVVMVVTSINDGKHAEGSFHYKGLAADLRSKTVASAQKHKLLAELKEALGVE